VEGEGGEEDEAGEERGSQSARRNGAAASEVERGEGRGGAGSCGGAAEVRKEAAADGGAVR
jgi:hypothetical protein